MERDSKKIIQTQVLQRLPVLRQCFLLPYVLLLALAVRTGLC